MDTDVIEIPHKNRLVIPTYKPSEKVEMPFEGVGPMFETVKYEGKPQLRTFSFSLSTYKVEQLEADAKRARLPSQRYVDEVLLNAFYIFYPTIRSRIIKKKIQKKKK